MSKTTISDPTQEMPRAPVGVLFDFNGVIADDERLHEFAFTAVLRNYNVMLTAEIYNRACLGRTDTDGFRMLQFEFPDTLANQSLERLVEQKQAEYQRLLPGQDVLYPGVLDILSTLKRSARLGIVSSATRSEVSTILKTAGISESFHTLITAEDIVRGKPDPEGYLKGIQGLALPRRRVVAVEDSRSGVCAAKAAQIKCIAVLHTTAASDLVAADITIDVIGSLRWSMIEALLED